MRRYIMRCPVLIGSNSFHSSMSTCPLISTMPSTSPIWILPGKHSANTSILGRFLMLKHPLVAQSQRRGFARPMTRLPGSAVNGEQNQAMRLESLSERMDILPQVDEGTPVGRRR